MTDPHEKQVEGRHTAWRPLQTLTRNSRRRPSPVRGLALARPGAKSCSVEPRTAFPTSARCRRRVSRGCQRVGRRCPRPGAPTLYRDRSVIWSPFVAGRGCCSGDCQRIGSNLDPTPLRRPLNNNLWSEPQVDPVRLWDPVWHRWVPGGYTRWVPDPVASTRCPGRGRVPGSGIYPGPSGVTWYGARALHTQVCNSRAIYLGMQRRAV